VLFGALGLAALTFIGGCPEVPLNGGVIFNSDTTLDTLTIAAGEVATVQNDAIITVLGDATIDGTLQAENSRITIIVLGRLIMNGTIRAAGNAPADGTQDDPLDQQPVGVFLIVSNSEVTFGADAEVSSVGPIVVTDDANTLDSTPADFYNDVEDVSGDELPTLVPLPPENGAFAGNGGGKVIDQSGDKVPEQTLQGGAVVPPITIGGVWPPAGAPPVPGDRPVTIFRFVGTRDLNLSNWTVNGPNAPNGGEGDGTNNPGSNSGGSNGKDGMRLNIRNNGGRINIVNSVVLNLANGGDGGSATAVCANATGGNGGNSGNFRMTAGDGIDITGGTLIINPGRGGNGGDALVDPGDPGADGCPAESGDGGTATGGNGHDNRKRLLVRGNVTGIDNITIGPLDAGNGGRATAEVCDGGDGDPCCDGGDGGESLATGGAGGDASQNVTGLNVTTSAVTAGNGGDAEATAGNGGDGGDCKFDDGGDGGDGQIATATGGAGGDASNTGMGGAFAGDGGDATATGGDGGDGADSTFGLPGLGGSGGNATASAGEAGTGTTPGNDGEVEEIDGNNGEDGEALPIVLFCLTLADFAQIVPGVILPGPVQGPVENRDEVVIGTIVVDFVNVLEASYQSSDQPVPHIGIQGGTLRIDVTSLELNVGAPGPVSGVQIAPLFAEGLSPSAPMIVRALGANGATLDQQTLVELPNNAGRPNDPLLADVLFNTTSTVATVEFVVPQSAFVTIIQIYLVDP
jgi:hypothetical protein